jgi:hypothetical protein
MYIYKVLNKYLKYLKKYIKNNIQTGELKCMKKKIISF